MSSSRETIDSVEYRLQHLEDVIGYSSNLELYRVFPLVTTEVQRLFQHGRDYSEQLMRLLYGFSRNNDTGENEHKLRIIISCYQKLMKSLKCLDQLESFMNELKGKMQLATEAQTAVEMKNISELPILMNKCHSLLIRSILVTKRFFEMNLKFNEYWGQIDEKFR